MLRLETRLQEINLRIESLQDAHVSESRSTRSSQYEALQRLLTQLHSLQENQVRTHEAMRTLGDSFGGSRETSSQLQNRNSITFSPQNHSSAIAGLKVQQFTSSACRQSCSCQCHTRRNWRSSQIMDQFLGTLFIGYSYPPSIVLTCDLTSCRRHQRKVTTFLYVFPYWLLRRVWSVVLLYSHRDGLSASLRTYRNRSPADMVFAYIDIGDLNKLKILFDKGDASPFDFSAEANVSLLHVRIL